MKQASGYESRFINLWLVPLEAGFGLAENDLIKACEEIRFRVNQSFFDAFYSLYPERIGR